jgi:hypothetical protein
VIEREQRKASSVNHSNPLSYHVEDAIRIPAVSQIVDP